MSEHRHIRGRCRTHGKRWCFACLLAVNPYFLVEHTIWNFLLGLVGLSV